MYYCICLCESPYQLKFGLQTDGGFLDPAARAGVEIDSLIGASASEGGMGSVHLQGGGADVSG